MEETFKVRERTIVARQEQLEKQCEALLRQKESGLERISELQEENTVLRNGMEEESRLFADRLAGEQLKVRDHKEKLENDSRREKEKLETQLAQFSAKSTHNPDDYNAVFPQFGEKEEDNATEVAQYSDNLTLELTLESARQLVKTIEAVLAATRERGQGQRPILEMLSSFISMMAISFLAEVRALSWVLKS